MSASTGSASLAVLTGPPRAEGAGFGQAERQVFEAARRGLAPGWGALAVLFHQFPAPGPRPHHRRVARAILDDFAQKHGGQVFGLRNLDLILLCPLAVMQSPPARAGQEGEALPDLLGRLLQGETETGAAPLVIWHSAEGRERLLEYAQERLAESGLSALDPGNDRAEMARGRRADAMGRALPELLLRQTGVLFASAGAQRIRPLYREIIPLAAALHPEPGGDERDADPFLLRHFAARLEARLLAALPAEAGRRGALDPARGPRLHLNLAPEAVVSGGFAAVAEVCRTGGVGLGVEISLVDAAADPDGFAAARRILAAGGITCVIDEVSVMALRLTRPATLAPDLVKLRWAPRLARLDGEEMREVGAALDEIGVDRVVLTGADAEAPLQWGLVQGIRRFQGSHVDAMLAASRLAACAEAGACTMRQCIERASAVALGGRAGCRNLGLLDAGAPNEGRR